MTCHYFLTADGEPIGVYGETKREALLEALIGRPGQAPFREVSKARAIRTAAARATVQAKIDAGIFTRGELVGDPAKVEEVA